MRSILVTGAGSGLGLAMIKQYMSRAQDEKTQFLSNGNGHMNGTVTTVIYAVDIAFPDDFPTPEPKQPVQLVKLTLDVSSSSQIDSVLAPVFQDESVALDLVIHSAGIRGLVPHVPVNQSSDVEKADCLEVMDAATMQRTFEINVLGTFLLLRTIIPALLRRAEELKRRKDYSPTDVPKVVAMGSRHGSVGSNCDFGGAYAYRPSKAGLNALIKSFSVDVPDVCWTVLHPGRVETRLIRIKEDGAMPVEECAVDVLKFIDKLNPKHNGRFLDRFSKDIPW